MRLEDLAGLRLTYDVVGSTRYVETPEGYHRLEYRQRIGEGDEVFHRAADALLSWRMQPAAGLPMTATDVPAQIGTNSLGRLGAGLLIGPSPLDRIGLPVPCRVVWTVNEPDRIGFAYGTLQGHPESGEESFVVTRDPDGIYFTVRAYSRGATWYTRLAGPATRKAQHYAARRYANALQQLATP
ncbi:uncharacterized protein (UPF0548 family) [Kribbella rubisoli]|uniref:Uncharacterized protein (UPF0548 family) n=1 Tax=Kribbella rubisoli TaxID=3075929 RepID=A0A4Q7WXK3_9ACTN|nr:DUF1990 domain-containing protein [Kribbella rubisoli]RZU15351.1 uncharacterized protein (UPF0548 family) [Kribbella rubisoli]